MKHRVSVQFIIQYICDYSTQCFVNYNDQPLPLVCLPSVYPQYHCMLSSRSSPYSHAGSDQTLEVQRRYDTVTSP